MNDLTLSGLDGTNPLAFFAALGVLGAVSDVEPQASMVWRHEGTWRPVLTRAFSDSATLVEALDRDRLSCATDPALMLQYDGKRDLKPHPERFHEFLSGLVRAATPQLRRSVDWASAFATDVALDNKGNTKPTALHFTAGQQQFLQMASDLVKGVTPEDLREALFGPWQYAVRFP